MHLHPDEADAVDQQEQSQAGKALLAEHLEIGAVIGAAPRRPSVWAVTIWVSPGGLGVDRLHLDLVLAIGLEAAAERVVLDIIPGPGPDRERGCPRIRRP